MKVPAILIAGLVALVSPLGASGAGGAQVMTKPRAVVELFTSQGCSSCPPADALLTELRDKGDVVALAYHVDYWNYIGWTDTFGSAAYSDYQRAYAQARGQGSIYTPQMMIDGTVDAVGSRRQEVATALGRTTLPLGVELAADDGMLSVAVDGDAALPESALWLVTFRRDATVKIDRGENANRQIAYSQIVTGRQVLGMWDPKDGAHLKLPLDEILGDKSDGAALIVQEDRHGLPGRILGAAVFLR